MSYIYKAKDKGNQRKNLKMSLTTAIDDNQMNWEGQVLRWRVDDGFGRVIHPI